MKFSPTLALAFALAASTLPVHAHGPAHAHRANTAEVAEALDEQGPAPTASTPGAPSAQADGKNFREPVIREAARNWGASLTTGYESRHVHYGVNETGNSGAWTNELGVWIDDFSLTAWNGFGLGTDFEEWDFTAAYSIEAGPVFLIPGYNFRWLPGASGHEHSSHDHHEEHGEHGHHEEHSDEASHAHLEYNNELFAVLGTDAIPYITPSAMFLWNLNDSPGGFLEFRLDGDIPLVKRILSLSPYALLGLNLGYNTTAEYGLNNFQFGIQADWRINEHIVAFAGVNYSIALAALEAIDQSDVAWGNAGVRFEF